MTLVIAQQLPLLLLLVVIVSLLVRITHAELDRPQTGSQQSTAGPSLQDLPPLAVEHMQGFLSERDQLQFARSSKKYLPAAFHPRSSERQSIRQQCGEEWAELWLDRYFSSAVEPRRSAELDLSEHWGLGSAVRNVFFRAECLQALSAFCVQDSRRTTAFSRQPIRIHLGSFTPVEMERLREDYRNCLTELTVFWQEGEHQQALSQLLLDRSHAMTFDIRISTNSNADFPWEPIVQILREPGVQTIHGLTLLRLRHPSGFRAVLAAIQENGHVRTLNVAQITVDADIHVRILTDALYQNLSIRELKLRHVPIDVMETARNFLWSLSRNQHLRSLDIWAVPMHLSWFPDATHAVLRQGKLESIRMVHAALVAADAVVLAKALQESTSIRTLDVSRNRIGSTGVAAIADAVSNHPSLETLVFTDGTLGADAVASLAVLLLRNQHLRSLSLSAMAVQTPLAPIMHSLRHNRGLAHLQLEYTPVDEISAILLRSALLENAALQKLVLTGCRMSPTSVHAILSGLHHNHRLTYLDLTNNAGGIRVARGISEMLNVNTALTHLVLRNLHLNYNAACLLLRGLAENRNSALRYLNLNGNQIGEGYGRSICRVPFDALSSLQTLELRHNHFHGIRLLSLIHDLVQSPALRNVKLGILRMTREEYLQFWQVLEQSSSRIRLQLEAYDR